MNVQNSLNELPAEAYHLPSPSQAFSFRTTAPAARYAPDVYMFNQAPKHKETERDYGIAQVISRRMRLDAGSARNEQGKTPFFLARRAEPAGTLQVY